MARKRSKRTPEECQKDYRALIGAGYEIHEFSEYHWHVRKKGNWVVVNVWPTAGKYMQVGAERTGKYTDVLEAMTDMFAHGEEAVPDEMAKKQVEEMRSQGLDYFINKSKKK